MSFLSRVRYIALKIPLSNDGVRLMHADYENKLRKRGYKTICGVDEAGLGASAGPIVAAAVVLKDAANALALRVEAGGNRRKGQKHWYINDSKKLSPTARDALYDVVLDNAVAVGIGVVPVTEINHYSDKPLASGGNAARVRAVLNLYKSDAETRFPHEYLPTSSFGEALQHAEDHVSPDYALVDHFELSYAAARVSASRIVNQPPQQGITHGDATSVSIAAASIVAKVYRDRYMQGLSLRSEFEPYHWGANMGYETVLHKEALQTCGPTPHHRLFRIKKLFPVG